MSAGKNDPVYLQTPSLEVCCERRAAGCLTAEAGVIMRPPHPPNGDPFRQMTDLFFFSPLYRVLHLNEKSTLTSSELHTPG